MSRRILVAAIALLLSACTGHRYSQHKVDLVDFEANQQAIIFLSLKTAPNFLNIRTPVSCDLVKIEPAGTLKPVVYRVKNHWTSGNDGWNSSLIAMMVQPGTYVFENLKWDVGNVKYSSSDRGVSSTGLIAFGGFTAEPGSVCYVGHLELTQHTNSIFARSVSITLDNIDQFEMTKAAVAQKYPHLAPKLTKAKYYPSGSHLMVKSPELNPALPSPIIP